MSKLNKALTISLAVAILAALIYLVIIIAIPQQSEKFTEFYILNSEGNAENYPAQVTPGEPVVVTIGIVNNEHGAVSYQVGITVDSIENKEISVGELAHKEKWQEIVSFIPDETGPDQKVEFWLYKDGDVEPYFEDPLYLVIDVIEP